uniref:Uncharacterized protein n=1 Tax=Oryza sativa subsp. japonica TaxID=39947 RepID=Q5Z5K5_ORYSJ|nr:hypothetical protein [Oryza sativa Japonica Group]
MAPSTRNLSSIWKPVRLMMMGSLCGASNLDQHKHVEDTLVQANNGRGFGSLEGISPRC